MTSIALVTGAGIGIGRATAKALAARGDHVVVTDVLEDEGRNVVREIRKAGGEAEFQHLDVTDTKRADAVVKDIETRFGKIDTIVANAGIAHRVPLEQLSDEKWDQTFDIDLKGMLRVIRPAAAGMKAHGRGAIVCLSSIMGVAYGWDEHVHYSAAKAGVSGLVRGLAVELGGHGVRVNGVAPGYIRTAQLLSEKHSLGPEGAKTVGEIVPLGRIGQPDDIADVVDFLASESARYLTGQVITVDGGLMVGRY
jgi:3-oxoacyl-[acyl-carrier protein] reductase